METTIYLEKKLTPEVLEGLEDKKPYFANHKRWGENFNMGATIKEHSNDYTCIYQPIKLTTDMVEKALRETVIKEETSDGIKCQYIFKDQAEAIFRLLSLNKEEEK